jgi:hypothetical protein
VRAWRHSRFFTTDVVVSTIVAIAIVVLGLTVSRSSQLPIQRTEVTVLSAPLAGGRPVPTGFLGLSFEYPALEAYAGANPSAINPLFERLVRNLSPGQAPVLRIGGDSADSTWWPISGVAPPPGVTYSLSTRWLRVTRALAQALGARLILGLNFEAGNRALAIGEAQALVDGIGRSTVLALELGNEPELYAVFPWYRTQDGRRIMGRPSNYDFVSFTGDFRAFAHALRPIPLAGPTVSGPGWTRRLDEFLAAEPGIRLVTLHHYPLQLCFVSRQSPRYPTINHLLTATASSGLAESFSPYVAIAHARGLPLRVDELNTVSCGADAAVSTTFASALWALDTLFEMARVGVDGVNLHTFPGAGYELFHFSHATGKWRATIAPEYYGLLMFADAAPPGSELLSVLGARRGPVKIWATLAPDRRIRVLAINKNASRPAMATIRLPAMGTATLERLQAPSLSASTQVTLGGRSFGSPSDSGLLTGQPQRTPLTPTHGRYVVNLPAASAALLTLTRP